MSGNLSSTYGTATHTKYPQAFEVTGISSTFSDSSNGFVLLNVPVGALEIVKHGMPEATN